MYIDSTPQPCHRCVRPTVLATYSWGRQWVHVGSWRKECEAPLSDPRDLLPSPVHASRDPR
ncbi:hypothetical protein GCM10012275_20990 [Longimycelium tulufanense]|uniref:Uncharacterized protein n=1 Tax=Longimycelium tulufanense TaxID=907463 RepID=A0A8J3FTI3_9PSEU|nr:hypothetical protein GCM10012275_20990 [Longimycelium tulufanense]